MLPGSSRIQVGINPFFASHLAISALAPNLGFTQKVNGPQSRTSGS